jgi:homopolymeric O-antigen transport system permease protein
MSLGALDRRLSRNCQLIVQMTKRKAVGCYNGSAMDLTWSFFNPLFMLMVYTWAVGTRKKT